MASKKRDKKKDLKNLDFSINEFGKLKSNIKLKDINRFLDENVEDKKLVEKREKEEGKEKD